MRVWTAVLLLGLACVSCGRSVSLGSSETVELGAAAPAAPDVLHVTCRADGSTLVESKRVSARADGVHIAVDNRAGEPASVGEFGDFEAGESSAVVPFVTPGRADVACYPYSKHEGPEPAALNVKVVDPEGHW